MLWLNDVADDASLGFDLGGRGDFAGLNFGFSGGINDERNGFYVDVVVFEGGFDDSVEFRAELFFEERVFDADFNDAIIGRN